jgi:hypothetical protein
MTNDPTTDPFAEDPEAVEDPFGDGGEVPGADEDFDAYEIPPIPIGVLAGYVKTAKKQSTEKDGVKKDNLILEIQCSDPTFANCQTVSVWLEVPKFIKRAAAFAAALGLTVTEQSGQVRLPKPSAFANKTGKFIFATYVDAQGTTQSTIAWGYPKPEKSPEFHAWVEANKYSEANPSGLTEDNIKDIRKSPGALPITFGT